MSAAAPGASLTSSHVRLAVVRCLLAVAGGESLSVALPVAQAALNSADRGLAQALANTTLRQAGAWRWLLERLLARPLKTKEAGRLEAVLGSALSELRQFSSAPHAVVHAAVSNARAVGLESAAGMVNAVLRRYLREREVLEAALGAQALAPASHPDWLRRRLQLAYGAQAEAICVANLTQAPMWLRVHPRAGTAGDYARRLPLPAQDVPGLLQALRLEAAMDIAALPGFAEGACSVQDLAAQHCAWLLAPRSGERVLDACAAPGGKTAHLLERGADGVLAIDSDSRRLDKVRMTLQRLRLQAEVRAADAAQPQSWWDGQAFDAILLDAPCSATGVIRRHPDILTLRRESDVGALAATQSALLAALWPLLKPGGRLLYATCSLLPDENEAVVTAFLAQHADARERPWVSPVPEAFSEPRAVGRLNLPGAAHADGFYIALLEKAGPVA